ncbi:DNA-repair protein [Arcticibacter svalbardensis MN12-7]|uniref:DNA-repair protein n=1 Tax=Arcticibacter svalbardensis MN12-7 TaxID=1150600 RepID=R9GYA2_9SPHI|nr:DEAD/DEAH box helicase family protein [Arcticibacter svalbardensis]EOR93964.1 DNA-repair protein [Arcticibacter svalbardensis MN12-7]
MLKDVSWPEDRSYRSGSEFKPYEFYQDALMNSTILDLLLGYFSTSAIHLLSLGFATFISKGGKLRMLINDVLSEKDKEAVLLGKSSFVSSTLVDLSDFKSIKDSLDEYGNHFFECIAWLINQDRIQLKVIRPKEGKGISHYKSGVFGDGINKVGFKASCNFTSYGLLSNLEEIEIYILGDDLRSDKFILKQDKYFEEIYSERADFVEYVPVEEIQAIIINTFANKDIDELLVQEKELLNLKKRYLKLDKHKELKPVFIAEGDSDYLLPKFPYKEGPRDYQIKAYDNWIANGYKGLFAMATGTGKTITALNCVLQEFRIQNQYNFVVLVPTIALADQWYEEATQKFNYTDIVICSSKHLGWEARVNQFGRNFIIGSNNNFGLIVTYATFRGLKFQTTWERNFKGFFSLLTLIADEAHTLGSAKLLKILPVKINKRIGLSATPERVYDATGQELLCNFFNAFPPHYTFVYNMQQAINDKILCKYYYYPVMVSLEPDELDAYRSITKKLAKYIDSVTGRYRESPAVSRLLIERKNVIHKARQKESTLLEIVDRIGPDKFKYVFIYVPEGNSANYDEQDTTISDEDDMRIVNRYTSLLYQQHHFKMRKFLGDTQDREAILSQFRNGEIDAVLAMKCLDEGVDVPRTQYAVFCSSTGNPRQYVQRRGRVLRFHKNKPYAYIYDMVVKPPVDITQGQSQEHKVEKNILMGELKRLINFAALAENKMQVMKSLEDLASIYEIDIYEMMNSELDLYEI